MRTVSTDLLAAISSNRLKARSLIWLTAFSFDDNSPISIGFWNGIGTVDIEVEDIDGGSPITRTYIGAGSLLTIDDIPLTNDVNVRTINVKLSQTAQVINDYARQYNLKEGPIEIHRAFFQIDSEVQLVDFARIRFVGYIDTSQIIDPAEGSDGSITLGLVSHTRQLTRTNGDVRSNASQDKRHSGDKFYQYTGVVGGWTIFWGQKRGIFTQ